MSSSQTKQVYRMIRVIKYFSDDKVLIKTSLAKRVTADGSSAFVHELQAQWTYERLIATEALVYTQTLTLRFFI